MQQEKTLTREAEDSSSSSCPGLLSHIFLNNSHIPVASSVKWDNDALLGFFTGIRQALEPQLAHLLIGDNNTILTHFTGLL